MTESDTAFVNRMVERGCGRVGTNTTRFGHLARRGNRSISQNPTCMPSEPLSPELALVDPELGARARAALPDRPATHLPPSRASRPVAQEAHAPAHETHRPYPVWARMTAALWLLVLGILIGGAAIPHAQDRPRVVPASEDPPALCKVPKSAPEKTPTIPGLGSPLRPGP